MNCHFNLPLQFQTVFTHTYISISRASILWKWLHFPSSWQGAKGSVEVV